MFWASLFQNTCQVVKCWVFQKQNEHFAKFTGKYLCKRLFFNKVAGLRLATLLKKRLWHRYFPGLQLYLKKRLWHRCFPVNFVKILKAPFFTEYLRATASDFSKMEPEESWDRFSKSHSKWTTSYFHLLPISKQYEKN